MWPAALVTSMPTMPTSPPVVGGLLGRLDAGVDLVVVRNGERVQSDRRRLLQEEVDRIAPVVGQRGMRVQLDR